MPRSVNREEELILWETDEEPTEVGEIKNVNGAIRVKDSIGIFNPRLGGFDPDLIMVDRVTGETLVDRITGNVLIGR